MSPQRIKKYFSEFCIICAKPEELRQVMSVLDRKFQKAKGAALTDFRYRIPSHAGDLHLYVTSCEGMGHLSAAIRTSQVITARQPGLILFVGTAASLKPAELQVGDVVLPRRAINRIYEKISEQGQKDFEDRVGKNGFQETFFDTNALIADIASVNCSVDAMAAIASLQSDGIALEGAEENEVEVGGQSFKLRAPKVFDDFDIFSCGMVVDSVSYREFLVGLSNENMRKVALIDMESYGFFSAIAAARQYGEGTDTQGIMIRGVSDYAGRKQQTEARPVGWKEKSVRNAAIAATALLENIAKLT